VIVQKLVERLESAGFDVYSYVWVNGLEIDVLALEHGFDRSYVYIYEVKSRAKPKLVKQVYNRIGLADYIYVVVPARLYPWVIKRLEPSIGVVFYLSGDLFIFRQAGFIGNGARVLEFLKHADFRAFPVMVGQET